MKKLISIAAAIVSFFAFSVNAETADQMNRAGKAMYVGGVQHIGYLGNDNDRSDLNTMHPKNIVKESGKVHYQNIEGAKGAKGAKVNLTASLVEMQHGQTYLMIKTITPYKGFTSQYAVINSLVTPSVIKYGYDELESGRGYDVYGLTTYIPVNDSIADSYTDLKVELGTTGGIIEFQFPLHFVQDFYFYSHLKRNDLRSNRKLF